MNKNRGRAFASLVVAVGGVLGACSVDTSDVQFVPDDVLASFSDAGEAAAEGGAPDGGGGKSNKGGTSNKAGSSSSGGAMSTGGKPASGGMPAGGTGTTAGAPNGGTPSGGMGGMMGCPLAMGDARQPLISDFESGDAGLPMMAGRKGGWYILNDGSRTGTQTPPLGTMEVKPERPGYGDVYALHTFGEGFTEWGAGVGASLLDLGHGTCRYDVSPHQGIRFFLKGTLLDTDDTDGLDEALHFHLVTAEVADVEHGGTCKPGPPDMEKCYDNYAFAIDPMPSDWQQVSIPFSVLKQGGWGAAKKLYLTHVFGIELVTTPSVDFEIWIDQVEFY